MDYAEHYRVEHYGKKIGDYYISSEGMYRFIPVENLPEEDDSIIFREWCTDSGWSESTVPLAFFQHRIDKGREFYPDSDVFGYFTDHYRLYRVK